MKGDVLNEHRPLEIADSSRRNGRSSGQRGSAIVEVAIAVPLLIAVFLGIAGLAMAVFARQDMIQASREGARILAVEDGTAAQATARANARLGRLASAASIVVTEPNPANPADCDVSVQTTVPFSAVQSVDLLGLFGSANMTVNVTMRKEGC